MTRNANNSMRKMAMTTLSLFGMLIGGLGSVGCDEQALDPAGARISATQNVPQFAALGEKSETRSLIWHPRR